MNSRKGNERNQYKMMSAFSVLFQCRQHLAVSRAALVSICIVKPARRVNDNLSIYRDSKISKIGEIVVPAAGSESDFPNNAQSNRSFRRIIYILHSRRCIIMCTNAAQPNAHSTEFQIVCAVRAKYNSSCNFSVWILNHKTFQEEQERNLYRHTETIIQNICTFSVFFSLCLSFIVFFCLVVLFADSKYARYSYLQPIRVYAFGTPTKRNIHTEKTSTTAIEEQLTPICISTSLSEVFSGQKHM